MKLKDATAGQHVWLSGGTECIVATGEAKIECLREVFRLDTFETVWLPFDTEVSTEPPPKPKPRMLDDLNYGTLVYIKEQHNIYSCAGDTTIENTYVLGYHGDGRYAESPNLIEGRDFTVYSPAQIDADGVITIRPAKNGGSE